MTDHIGDTNKMITAVEWLFLMLNNPNNDQEFANKILEGAKVMEKKQIENAHLSGLLRPLEMETTKQAEQYYNETYAD